MYGKLERTAPTLDRREELKLIFSDLIDDGYERGYDEGKIEGKIEECYAIAKRMLEQGFDPKVIAGITRLTLEQIASLRA